MFPNVLKLVGTIGNYINFKNTSGDEFKLLSTRESLQ